MVRFYGVALVALPAAEPVSGGAATLFQFGALGVITAAALFFAWRVYRDDQTRIQQLHTEILAERERYAAEIRAERERSAALERDIRDRVVPLLTEVIRLTTVSTDVLRERGRRES